MVSLIECHMTSVGSTPGFSNSLMAAPNPATALPLLTPKHQWFTLIDLANVFFCLPLDPA